MTEVKPVNLMRTRDFVILLYFNPHCGSWDVRSLNKWEQLLLLLQPMLAGQWLGVPCGIHAGRWVVQVGKTRPTQPAISKLPTGMG